jgi:hypothetical protein
MTKKKKNLELVKSVTTESILNGCQRLRMEWSLIA